MKKGKNIIKENDIKNKIKEVIFGKDIKMKLFEEMEEVLLSKYNLGKISKCKTDKIEKTDAQLKKILIIKHKVFLMIKNKINN